MRMSFGLPCPAELWASPARPSLQATAGPWDCASHSSQPLPAPSLGSLPVSVLEAAQLPGMFLRLSHHVATKLIPREKAGGRRGQPLYSPL